MSRYRLAVDIGGTFTDFVLYDGETGRHEIGKNLTTPDNRADGVLTGMTQLVGEFADLEFFVHGTTAGINAFLERRGARVALITTAGFRDVYGIGRTNRTEMYNLFYRKPEPLVPRCDVYEVCERMGPDGSVIEQLDEQRCAAVIEEIAGQGFESVAVCFLFAYANPTHELRIREMIAKRIPGLSVTLSHLISNEWREYERTSTAVINAYVAPAIERYLSELETRVRARGFGQDLYIMQSNGGLMTSEAARTLPIQTLFSGPVGGTIGGRELGGGNLLCVDMGGTSFDVSLVVDGQADVRTETVLEGFPVLMPVVNIHSIGAGGGSIAWLEGGGLRVGPHSAGADPGPACYGRGGRNATVTDANLYLGRLDPQSFLGGAMRLDMDAARAAIESIASQLDMDGRVFADGMLSIVNAKMANAIRQLTIKKGLDPRSFNMVGFGGAGPMHAVFLAEELDIDTVIVPPMPGTFSAWGMLQTDLRHDVAMTFIRPLDGMSADELAGAYASLEARGATSLGRQGISAERIGFIRQADMRYVGQEYTVNLTLGQGEDAFDVAGLMSSFHDLHESQYGHCDRRESIEFVALRVAAVGMIDRPRRPGGIARTAQARPGAVREAYFSGQWVDTAIYQRTELSPGDRLASPAIVDELSSTTVIPPGYDVHIDQRDNIVIVGSGCRRRGGGD